MKVILTQTVPGVGDAGTIKEVGDGYARNYLLPKRLAVVATRGSVKQAETQAVLYARKANKLVTELQKSAAAVRDKTVTIRARAGSENRLYGSVTPADVAEALQSQFGITMDRRRIELDEAIHRLGMYGATADLGNGVTAHFNVEVAPEVAGAGAGATATTGKASRASGESRPEEARSSDAAVAEHSA